MNNNITIRPMLETDAVALAAGFAAQGWGKPVEQFQRYFQEQQEGVRKIFVAERNGEVAGYTTLFETAAHGPWAGQPLPIIVDFNVLIKFQRQGIGNAIMDAAEAEAAKTAKAVTLGVGLHSGYGSAQRMYVKRGYIPDGSGVWFRDEPLEQYAPCENDDDLVLYLMKTLD